MADLALRLKVFIASPNDVAKERDIAEEVLRDLNDEFGRLQLLLHVFRWEGATPSFGNPQIRLNRELRTAELTIVILGSHLGTVVDGSLETHSLQELRIAGEQVSAGRSDDVFVYFRNPTDSSNGAADAGFERLQQFRRHLEQSNQLLCGNYDSPAAFKKRLQADLRRWLERWRGVPDVCAYAVERALPSKAPVEYLADNRIDDISRVFDLRLRDERTQLLGSMAVNLYQTRGPTPKSMILTDVDRERNQEILQQIPESGEQGLWSMLDEGEQSADSSTISKIAQIHFASNQFQFAILDQLRATGQYEIVKRDKLTWSLNFKFEDGHVRPATLRWQGRDKATLIFEGGERTFELRRLNADAEIPFDAAKDTAVATASAQDQPDAHPKHHRRSLARGSDNAN